MEDSVRLRSEPLAGELPSCHESGIFCDVLLHTEEDGKVTGAHAVVLAAAATAGFRSMLQVSGSSCCSCLLRFWLLIFLLLLMLLLLLLLL